MKIVVVGAGVSGLTCAVTLLEAGAEVVVWTAGAPSGTVSAVACHDGSGVFWSWGCAAEVAGLCGLDQARSPA